MEGSKPQRKIGPISIGGIIVIVGAVLWITGVVGWVLGVIIILIGLIAFGGFSRGKWY